MKDKDRYSPDNLALITVTLRLPGSRQASAFSVAQDFPTEKALEDRTPVTNSISQKIPGVQRCGYLATLAPQSHGPTTPELDTRVHLYEDR